MVVLVNMHAISKVGGETGHLDASVSIHTAWCGLSLSSCGAEKSQQPWKPPSVPQRSIFGHNAPRSTSGEAANDASPSS